MRARATPTIAAIRELVARFEAGDYLGALAASDTVLDPSLVLASTGSGGTLSEVAERLLDVIEDRAGATVEEVALESGLSMIDALRGICELLDRAAVRFL